ncbi:hypothetical protein JOB18_000823 [Solea senegalensis]|uniref:Uncharacterized protein n=1 Tax=Solea senegalensis TaxID=28829 RepID=A0AAV6R5X7_SOLSE|nr:hypothetical protein JOB18_000823 [Solea senegalensis]
MRRRQQIRRKVKEPTRRRQLKLLWSTPVLSAGLRCLTPRLSNSTLRANTQSPLCLLSWQMFKHEELQAGVDLNLDTQ